MAVPPDFTAGQVLTAAQMNKVGMWLVTSTTMNGASKNIDNCFSADFDNYRMVISNVKFTTTTTGLYVRMRVSGADDTGNNYNWAYNGRGQTGVDLTTQNQNQSWALTGIDGDTFNVTFAAATFDIYQPNKAVRTLFTGQSVSYFAGGSIFTYARSGMMWHNLQTAYTGITLLGNTGNLSADIAIYGYNNG